MGRPNDLKPFFIMTCLGVKNQFLLQQESVNTAGVRNTREWRKKRI